MIFQPPNNTSEFDAMQCYLCFCDTVSPLTGT